MIRNPDDQLGLMLRSPCASPSRRPLRGLLRMRLKGRLEAAAELITRKVYDFAVRGH